MGDVDVRIELEQLFGIENTTFDMTGRQIENAGSDLAEDRALGGVAESELIATSLSSDPVAMKKRTGRERSRRRSG